jgi:hypothetical protein
MVIDTHSPNSPISSERSLAVYPSSWIDSSISAAVNGVLMVDLQFLLATCVSAQHSKQGSNTVCKLWVFIQLNEQRWTLVSIAANHGYKNNSNG